MTKCEILKKNIEDECKVPGNHTQTGTNFCRYVLTQMFDLTDEEADDALTGGSDDAGIDAGFERFSVFTLLQTKYSSNDHWANITRLVNDGDNFKGRELSTDERKRLGSLLELYDERTADGPLETKLVYVTSQSLAETVRQKVANLQVKRPELEVYDLDGMENFLEDKIYNLSPRWRGQTIELKTGGRFEKGDTVICDMLLRELFRLAKNAGEYLFASNVRNYLPKSKINDRIAETIKDKPDKFWYFNNGVTLVCEDYKLKPGAVLVKTPQVVNGCQTVSTLRNVAKHDGPVALDDASVLVRIIKTTNATLTHDITKSTNSQNAVRGKDLYALDSFHKKLKKLMRSVGYMYETQRGEAAGLSEKQIGSYEGDRELRYLEPDKWKRVIPALEAVQAYTATFAIKPEIAHARSEQITPLGDLYSETFPAELQADADRFLIPYLIVTYARKRMHYGRGATDWRKVGYYLLATTAHMLVALACGRATIDDLKAGKANVEPSDYRLILRDPEKGLALLELADGVLDSFFDDGKVQDILDANFNGDVKNLMKRKLVGSEWYKLLLKRVVKAFERKGSSLCA